MNLYEIARRYDRSAPAYPQHDALEREVGKRLIERVEFKRLDPKRVLDLGCGTGRLVPELNDRFPGAEIVGLDLSTEMLRRFRDQPRARGHFHCTRGDLTQLPFAARSFDLVFSNLALHWATDFVQALNEIRRVLNPEGMVLFTVPGPDSLRELRVSGSEGMDLTIPIYMPDLRDVGDCLVAAGFRDPVMDTESIALKYGSESRMRTELEITGGAGFAALADPPDHDSPVEISFEIVYGVAFGPGHGQPTRTQSGDVVTFPADQLKKL